MQDAFLAIIKMKLWRSAETLGKLLEMVGRKAMGTKVLTGAMPARPPDTLHPYIGKERIKRRYE